MAVSDQLRAKYAPAIEYMERLGLKTWEHALLDFDWLAGELNLSPATANVLVMRHAYLMALAFHPKTYTRLQRLALAWHFLRGKALA